LACAQAAIHAGFWFVLFGIVATVTGVLCPQVRLADAAVHAAWSDEVLGDLSFHFEGTRVFRILQFNSAKSSNERMCLASVINSARDFF
jgi:hypothetical protein